MLKQKGQKGKQQVAVTDRGEGRQEAD